MAKVLVQLDYEHFEADMFFERNSSYVFDGSRIKEAHAWCRQSAKQALDEGKRVVVSNTFTRLVEMEPYLSMAKKVRVIEATGRWQNTHDVPQETLQSMATRWETLPTGNRLRA
jgi:predicted kinase